MLTLHTGSPPKGYKQDFESYIFNTKRHRSTQSVKGWIEFHLIDTRKKIILGSISFCIVNRIARSPMRAPFGSFELSARVRPKDFNNFVNEVESNLRAKRINSIRIICPPEIYSDRQLLVSDALNPLNYKVAAAEPGSVIIIDSDPLVDKMGKDKLRRLSLGTRAGLSFKTLANSKLPTIYRFINKFRKKKNRKLSMSLAQLSRVVERLPKSFFLSGVYLDKRLVCGCISVFINKSILYTFYSAHDDAFDNISPRVFLIDQLYKWCYQHNIKMLDLGTSALDGKPNLPLLDFKSRMGSTLTTKFSFQKSWD